MGDTIVLSSCWTSLVLERLPMQPRIHISPQLSTDANLYWNLLQVPSLEVFSESALIYRLSLTICTPKEDRGATIKAVVHSEFATSWIHKFAVLVKCDLMYHWRDPTYLIAKLTLNIMSGLFIRVCFTLNTLDDWLIIFVIQFTFFKAKDSQQATQNKVFVYACNSL